MLIRPLMVLAPDETSGGGAEVQAPVEGTPENPTNTPEQVEGTGGGDASEQESVDWQQKAQEWESRYKEAQSWGTKLSQQAKVIEAWNSDDPNAQAWAAEQLGIQLEDDTPADTQEQYAQLDPQVQQQLEQLFAAQQQQQQAEQEQQFYQAYRADVNPKMEQLGVPEGVRDAVAEAALALPLVETPHGEQFDLEGAFNQLKQFAVAAGEIPDVRQKWLEDYKASKQAPFVSPAGTAGTQVPDLDKMSRSERHAYMTEQYLASQQ